MKRQNHLQQSNLALFLGLLLCAAAMRGQQADEPAGGPTPKPTTEEVEKPMIETNDAAIELQIDKDEGVSLRGSGRRMPEIVKFGSDAIVREGEEVGEVVVIFGDATIDGKVRGNVVVVAGDAKVNGTIGGELVVPLGSAELGPRAHIEGDVTAIGGGIKADPEAKVDGNPTEISWTVLEEKFPPVTGVKNWIMHGLILVRPLPPQFGWWWWVALACAVMYLLIALIFARPITASVGTLESQPVGSFFMGVLVLVLFVPLLLLLVATGLGIIVVPFVFCAAIVAFLFGKVAVYRFLGLQVGKQLGVSILQLPIVALLVGIAILYLVYMIPILGFVVWFIVAPLGLGAVTLAAFRAFRSEGSRAGNPSAAVPAAATVASLGPSAAGAATQPPVIGAQGASAMQAGDPALLSHSGFWIRFAATFLDLLLIGALLSVAHLRAIFLVVWVAYHVGMWTWKGTTIGGVVFGIKVIRKDGRPLDFAVALVRSLASFLSFLALFLGFFWVGWNREKLAWHDMIAGTIIVRVPKGLPLL